MRIRSVSVTFAFLLAFLCLPILAAQKDKKSAAKEAEKPKPSYELPQPEKETLD